MSRRLRTAIARVKARAKALEALLHEYESRGELPSGFGGHGLRLSRPVGRAKVERLEAEHAIRLPEDYRAFLLEVGNSGAGPGYGLWGLSDWWGFMDCWDNTPPAGPRPRVSKPRRSYLASPCPIRPGVYYGKGWAVEPKECAEALGLDWAPWQGSVMIAHHGCEDHDNLIVSGPGRGRIVQLSIPGIAPSFVPYPDFLSWYESWQDAVLNFQLSDWRKHIWEDRQRQITPPREQLL